jgi:phospholipase C
MLKILTLLIFTVQVVVCRLPTKVMVIMFENRSFDNILGYLHNGTAKSSQVEGIIGKNITNPFPALINGKEANVYAKPGTVWKSPSVDPGESYPHIMTQIYGDFIPISNYGKGDTNQDPPYNVPTTDSMNPNMKGFVLDYASVLNQSGHKPNLEFSSEIMNVLTKDEVPVIHTLAENFLVFDHWFCDVPSMTYTNRRFFQSATSNGYLLNHIPDFKESPSAASRQTIFNQLESAGKTWKVYYPKEYNIFSISMLLDFNSLFSHREHFVDISELFNDLQQGSLPDYSFIEPAFLGYPSDYHPTDSDNIGSNHSSILAGEVYLSKVYESVRSSPERDNVLLLITFDEAGGTMDHVPPPKTNPPNTSPSANEFNFTFDRLGVRVPTIMVNSYVKPGTVYNGNLQHTSFLGFVRRILNMSTMPLTERDAMAPEINISEIFTDNIIAAWPDAVARPYSNPTNEILSDIKNDFKKIVDTFASVIANESTGNYSTHTLQSTTLACLLSYLLLEVTCRNH